ncbi:hypothetical protein GA0115238_11317, partial [Streptomyces sp. di50b]
MSYGVPDPRRTVSTRCRARTSPAVASPSRKLDHPVGGTLRGAVRLRSCTAHRVPLQGEGDRHVRDQGQGSAGVGVLRLLVTRVDASLRAAVVLPGPVLERTRAGALGALRAGTLRAGALRAGALRAGALRAGALCLPGPLGQSGSGPLRRPRTVLCLLRRLPVTLRLPGPLTLMPLRPRPLPLRQSRPLLLPGSALRLARAALGVAGAALGVAGAAGPLLLARAVLRRTGTDGARQRLADLELGPLGHLADLGHDVPALAHESVVDREVVGGGGGG